jgi:hypothetical protein
MYCLGFEIFKEVTIRGDIKTWGFHGSDYVECRLLGGYAVLLL